MPRRKKPEADFRAYASLLVETNFLFELLNYTFELFNTSTIVLAEKPLDAFHTLCDVFKSGSLMIELRLYLLQSSLNAIESSAQLFHVLLARRVLKASLNHLSERIECEFVLSHVR